MTCLIIFFFPLQFFSSIVNCHSTLRKGKAVPLDQLCARAAQSSGKSKQTVSDLLKVFMKTCPEVFNTKVYNKVEQLLGHYCKTAPDFDNMEKKIQEALSSARK